MKVWTLIRQLCCSHPDNLRKSGDDGTFYLECMTCGRCTPGIPTGPGWHLVNTEGK